MLKFKMGTKNLEMLEIEKFVKSCKMLQKTISRKKHKNNANKK